MPNDFTWQEHRADTGILPAESLSVVVGLGSSCLAVIATR